jgi:hypothetical protein
MKRILLPLCVAVAIPLAGCLVTSVHPFYTEKDLAFEAAVLGEWGDPAEPDVRWLLEKQGEQAYRLTHTESGKSSVMRTHLFKVRGQSFFDLFPSQVETEGFPPPIPAHYLLRVLQFEPKLRMAPLKYDWLQTLLEQNPKALRHHVVANPEKPDDRRLVLTADTAELQGFVVQHLDNADAWKDVIELERRGSKKVGGAP